MVKTFTVKSLLENEQGFSLSDRIQVRKKDLGQARPKLGDRVMVIIYPNFPRVIAALDLNGERIFTKSREKVIDEYLGFHENQLMYQLLPLIAKERVKMFASMDENFLPADRLREVVALSLGYRLFERCYGAENPEEKIAAFEGLSINEQIEELPMFWHPILPQIPAHVVVAFATAFLHDKKAGLTGVNKNELLKSEVMKLPNATAENRGTFCEPRREYIERYLAAMDEP